MAHEHKLEQRKQTQMMAENQAEKETFVGTSAGYHQ